MKRFRDVVVDYLDHLHRSSASLRHILLLKAGRLPSFRQNMEHLSLPLMTMFDILYDALPSIVNNLPVSRIRSARKVLVHSLKACHIRREVFKYSCTMSKDVVPSKHSIFFLEYKGHMVGSMTGTVQRTQYSPLSGETLAIFYGKLTIGGTMFVDPGIRTELEQVVDTTNMIRVPMRQ